MNRRALVRHLQQHGCILEREGSKHSVYRHTETRRVSTVPRHTHINEILAKKICRDLGIDPP